MEFHSVKEILAAIEETRAQLVKTVAGLPEKDVLFQLAPDKWSVALLVEHLAKTEESLIVLTTKLLEKAEVENVFSDGTIEPPVSFAELERKASGEKFTAPAAVAPDGTATLAVSLTRLERSRANLHALRSRLEAVSLSNAKFPHPFFGAMDLYHWLAFIGVHEARHLEQISTILAALPKN